TKEAHLCHVIIASSDGYFMNRIYNDSKLTKTSDFFEVNYLSKKDVQYWLTHLEQESGISAFTLTDKQIEMIWKYLSGSMFDISSVLAKLIPRAKNKCVETKNIKKEIDRLITINCGKFEHYIQLHKQKFKLFQQILIIHEKKNIFF
ncbi:MAG: hypothetical protein OMM_13515, partial [Candidatus Magnetoglobus multicellularis str. Araruama]